MVYMNSTGGNVQVLQLAAKQTDLGESMNLAKSGEEGSTEWGMD